MNHSTRYTTIITACLLIAGAFLCPAQAAADVTLPKVFGSNMVMQRDIALPVWGQADAGGTVTVTLNAQVKSATAGEDGKWMVRLEPMPAGGPYAMTIAGDKVITIKNALVGEVWPTAAVREREVALRHVGEQYRKAIERYVLAGPRQYPRAVVRHPARHRRRVRIRVGLPRLRAITGSAASNGVGHKRVGQFLGIPEAFVGAGE